MSYNIRTLNVSNYTVQFCRQLYFIMITTLAGPASAYSKRWLKLWSSTLSLWISLAVVRGELLVMRTIERINTEQANSLVQVHIFEMFQVLISALDWTVPGKISGLPSSPSLAPKLEFYHHLNSEKQRNIFHYNKIRFEDKILNILQPNYARLLPYLTKDW